MDVIGPLLPHRSTIRARDGSKRANEWPAGIAPSYFNNRKVSIYGRFRNEIQRNMITKGGAGTLVGGVN